MLRGLTAAVVLFGMGGLGSSAAAAELELASPSSCASRDDLSSRVEQTLGHPLAETRGPRFLVRMQRAATGFEAQLEIVSGGRDGARGHRSLSGATCEDLTRAVALAIALAIGAELRAPSASLPSVSAEPPPHVELPPEPDAPVPSELESAAAGPAWAMLAGTLLDTGSLPVTGVGVTLGASLVWDSVELRALGTFLPERRGGVVGAVSERVGARVGLLAGGLLGCLPMPTSVPQVGLLACAGGEFGQLWGVGTGVDQPHPKGTLWSAFRVDLAARWQIPASIFGLELSMTGAVPLSRDEFILKDIGTVHRPAKVVGRAGLGLGLRFD